MISLWLLVCFIPLCSCRAHATLKSTREAVQPVQQATRRSRWNLVKDKHQHAEKSFVKSSEKKPTLEGVNTVSQSHSIGKRPKIDQRRKPGLPMRTTTRRSNTSSVFAMENVCTPERYNIKLQHGNCTRLVETTMCYGMCKSYTLPVAETFHSAATSRHGLANACQCCAPRLGTVEVAGYEVICHIDGKRSKKTFYVPLAEACECKQCVIN